MYFNEIDLEEGRDRLTREGMADVIVSRVVDHKSVQAWADSLGADEPLPVPSPEKAAHEAASSKSKI
jgi:predicted transcriptional regulator